SPRRSLIRSSKAHKPRRTRVTLNSQEQLQPAPKSSPQAKAANTQPTETPAQKTSISKRCWAEISASLRQWQRRRANRKLKQRTSEEKLVAASLTFRTARPTCLSEYLMRHPSCLSKNFR